MSTYSRRLYILACKRVTDRDVWCWQASTLVQMQSGITGHKLSTTHFRLVPKGSWLPVPADTVLEDPEMRSSISHQEDQTSRLVTRGMWWRPVPDVALQQYFGMAVSRSHLTQPPPPITTSMVTLGNGTWLLVSWCWISGWSSPGCFCSVLNKNLSRKSLNLLRNWEKIPATIPNKQSCLLLYLYFIMYYHQTILYISHALLIILCKGKTDKVLLGNRKSLCRINVFFVQLKITDIKIEEPIKFVSNRGRLVRKYGQSVSF